MMTTDELHPDDVAERHRQITVANEVRAVAKRAEANRAHGIAAPRVGGKLYVTTARGVLRRNRGGLRFEPTIRREITVIDVGPVELLDRQRAGEGVASVDGAEQILADDSLVVHSTGGAGEDDLAQATARNIVLEADNHELRAQLAAARKQAPPDPGDGSSSRLKAAAKVRDGGGEFGGHGGGHGVSGK